MFFFVVRVNNDVVQIDLHERTNDITEDIENYLNAILDFDKTVDFYLDSNLNNKEVVNWFNEGLNYSENAIFMKYNITEEYKKMQSKILPILNVLKI